MTQLHSHLKIKQTETLHSLISTQDESAIFSSPAAIFSSLVCTSPACPSRSDFDLLPGPPACNFTEDELKQRFITESTGLTYQSVHSPVSDAYGLIPFEVLGYSTRLSLSVARQAASVLRSHLNVNSIHLFRSSHLRPVRSIQ